MQFETMFISNMQMNWLNFGPSTLKFDVFLPRFGLLGVRPSDTTVLACLLKNRYSYPNAIWNLVY